MILFVLFALLAVLLYRKIKSSYTFFDDLGIIGPKPMFLFGNIGEFKHKNPLDVFATWSRIYGKVYGYYVGLTPSMVVSDPNIIQHILVDQFENFHDRPLTVPFLYYPDNCSLLVTHGDMWKTQRQIVSNCFNTISLNQALPKLVIKSEQLLQRLEDDVQVMTNGMDICDIMERHMLDSFAYVAFDYDCKSLTHNDEVLYNYVQQFNLSASTENVCTGLARLFPNLSPICQWFTGDLQKAHNAQIKQLKEFLYKEKHKLSVYQKNQRSNLLKTILTTKATSRDVNNNTNKRSLSDEEILAQMTSLVAGGLSTSGSLISFLIYCLAMHQDVQKNVLREIESVFTENDKLTLEQFSRLTYLDMVINETLRCFPVAPGVARTCTSDTSINGIQFKRGTVIRVMSCVMYNDDDIFPEPHKFIPERFSRSECMKRHPFTWLPFGQGPKNCVGKRLGLLKCKLTVVQILMHYQILPTILTEVPLKTKLHPMLAPKNGVHVKLVPRLVPDLKQGK